MSQKTKMLNRIIHYLILNASFIRDLGLLNGNLYLFLSLCETDG